ncbi:unnamed protein product [Polarella glacialis]|uniref:C3H1-type domain-containing protein n=1 Tax=Polarella glacialis TaxID=89957 RepID=A0A813L5Z6_POLGL|nr:unnamed protein product [Polarella glacialis]CAE8717487.1 unnamed protein product [Polarella glacialis]
MFPSAFDRFDETDETDLAERQSLISSLNIECSRLFHKCDTSAAMFPSASSRFEEAETDLPFVRPEAFAERLRLIASLNIEGSRLPHSYNTSAAMFSSTLSRSEETDETDLSFARSPEAFAQHRSIHRLCAERRLTIEPSLLRYAVKAPPGFEDVAPPAVQAPQAWSTEEEPRSPPIAPPGARFLTTWPSTTASPSATSTSAGSDDPVLFTLPPHQVPVLFTTASHVGTDVLSGACHDVALMTSFFEGFGWQGDAEEVQTDWSPNLTGSRVKGPSIGSMRHNRGRCKPCAFFTTEQGCHGGLDCLFCHSCQPGEKKRRDEEKRRLRRQRVGATALPQPQPTDSTWGW